jgi:hypothetical protein
MTTRSAEWCERISASKTHDLTGRTFSLLTVLHRDRSQKFSKPTWVCRCACGTIKSVRAANLLRGDVGGVKSCGCLLRRRGPEHPGWKGSRRISDDGYVILTIWEDGERREVREHRYVMEQHLGRRLLPEENVHHKHGDRQDNRLENLELWVKVQPCGQRVVDLVDFAMLILRRYAPDAVR